MTKAEILRRLKRITLFVMFVRVVVFVLPWLALALTAIGVTLVWGVILAGGSAVVVAAAIVTARFLGVAL